MSYWDTSGSDWIDSDQKGVPILAELGVDIPLPHRFVLETGALQVWLPLDICRPRRKGAPRPHARNPRAGGLQGVLEPPLVAAPGCRSLRVVRADGRRPLCLPHLGRPNAAKERTQRNLERKSAEQKQEADYRHFQYKTDEHTYTGYENQLRDMHLNYDNYDHLTGDQYFDRVHELQRKMKQVRERMEAHGVKRSRSFYETWVPDSYNP